ncbi:LLM class flavin-dependent oxidoreductase [Actinoplanes sp. NPDC049265]|uniref:LLM class flavin-dependent oxidoreductase n=1 Tax=Actinoplanes sp. NPDC049265 TaxID=3363902 RepID=UPI003718D8D0
MTAIGVTFRPQNPPENLKAAVRLADELGVDELWLWEDCFLNGGISATAAALAWSERIRVGIGLTPVPFRNVVAEAMEIATLHRMFGDRAIVGVGHGVQEWMQQVGARAASPLTLLREWVTALRALLAGEEVTTTGKYVNLDKVKLDWPPATVPPIVVGAMGPKTLKLAGEVADETILVSSLSPDGVREARELIGDPAHKIIMFAPHPRGRTGDVRATVDAVQQYIDAGAATVVLEPDADEPDLHAFLRFVGEEITPRFA